MEVEGQFLVLAELPVRERPDARTAFFWPGRSDNIMLNSEVPERSSRSRMTRRMAQDGWLPWSNILVWSSHCGVQEHQRRARDAVNHAVLDSSARCETAVSMESRAAQRNGETTTVTREREILFKIGSEAQAPLRHPRAHLLTEHTNSLWKVLTKDSFVRHHVDFGPKSCKW